MFCEGSFISHVLQWRQFWELICSFLILLSSIISYTPAGQYNRSGELYIVRLWLIGVSLFISSKWQGWFSEWLVPEKDKLVSLSKLIIPSGLLYIILGHFLAGFVALWSAWSSLIVHGALPLSIFGL